MIRIGYIFLKVQDGSVLTCCTCSVKQNRLQVSSISSLKVIWLNADGEVKKHVTFMQQQIKKSTKYQTKTKRLRWTCSVKIKFYSWPQTSGSQDDIYDYKRKGTMVRQWEHDTSHLLNFEQTLLSCVFVRGHFHKLQRLAPV